MLLSTYKEKLFNESDNKELKNDFAKAVFQTYNKQSSLTSRGITLESLNMIRTRFILDWYNTYAAKFPYKLFDYQQQLIREGMFEAYNSWLFDPLTTLSHMTSGQKQMRKPIANSPRSRKAGYSKCHRDNIIKRFIFAQVPDGYPSIQAIL